MTTERVDLVAGADPLLRDVPLAYAAELQVLGIRTRFETNSRYLLGVVAESFGAVRADGPDGRAAVRVRMMVVEGGEPGEPAANAHVPVRHLCPDLTRLVVHSPGSVGVSDPARREAVAFVTRAFAADRGHFRSAMLEALTFSLLSHFDRHPLHAACVVRGGHALLLAGASGAGKSTLAYVAHRAGLAVLGDDHVWVQLRPRPGVWGQPQGVRLLPEARALFAELASHPSAWANGKEKLLVPLDRAAPLAALDHVSVCVLERGERSALHRADPETVRHALTRRMDPGFDRYPERHRAVAQALSAGGGWRLVLSPDPNEALPHLRRMLDAA